MNARPLRPALLIAALVLITAGPALAFQTLIVQVRTDAVPVAEFDLIRTTLFLNSDPAQRYEYDDPAVPSRDYAQVVRVFEHGCVPAGRHLLEISLIRRGVTTVMRPVRVDIEGDSGPFSPVSWNCHADAGLAIVRVLLSEAPRQCADDLQCREYEECQQNTCELRPFEPIDPLKLYRMKADRDGSGTVTAGDIIEYTVAFFADHIVRRGSFLEDTPSGGRLVAGSVRTTHGTVFSGNFPNDRTVRVDYGLVPRGDTVTVNYDVEVLPELINQGTLHIVSEDTDYAIVTDDPTTAPRPDATKLAIQCAPDPNGQQCCDGLAQCADEAAALRHEVADLRQTLGRLLDDKDADGVPAVSDACPDTTPGAPVDADGCSIEQFCGAVDAAGEDWQRVCRRSDWGNDEPLAGNPQDCQPNRREGVCAPR